MPGKIRLADSHLHLQDDRLLVEEETVIRQALEAGIERLVVNGSQERDWPQVWRLARKYPQVVPCFGLHPWYVERRSSIWLDKLEWFLESLPSGVGEIGLDRYQPNRNESAQKEVFRAQLDLAVRLRRPVLIHCLHAWGWLTDCLSGKDPFPAGLMIHAYSGSPELISALAAKGVFFSFAATFLEEKRARARQALLAVPQHRLLLETDAPDLPLPEEYRPNYRRDGQGKRIGEPADLAIVYREAALLRQESLAQMAAALWKNSDTLLQTILPSR